MLDYLQCINTSISHTYNLLSKNVNYTMFYKYRPIVIKVDACYEIVLYKILKFMNTYRLIRY